MEWFEKVFSGSVDFSRAGLPGLLVMLCGVGLVAAAGRIARRFRPQAPDYLMALIKIAGLITCAGGAMLAILG